jgi:sterol desaturase/sphingolipid hydroxylase (fatty acid hydroxylase superfamily)
MLTMLEHASQAYAAAYFGIMIVISLLEWVVPRRKAGDALMLRWAGNVGISFVNTLLIRTVFPLAAIAWAGLCAERGWGLLNRAAVSPWVALPLSIAALDFMRYIAHWLFHRVPVLWQIHSTHHTDHEVDFTTGIRFHPAEVLISEAVGFAMIAVIGVPPFAVLLFSLLAVSITFFEHANVHLPATVDAVLRLVIVTPDMHRVHHSQVLREGNSNFGSLLPWWDRLCGTYIAEPEGGDGVRFGVAGFDERKHLWLHWMLAKPLIRPVAAERGQSALGRWM